MDDNDVVRGEVHIELETVRTRRHADVERRNRVLGTQGAAPSMRENLRAAGKELIHVRAYARTLNHVP